MLPVAIFVCCGWIVSVCIHEFGHAVVAYWGGDTSVKDKGYLTLNPLKYTDPGLSLILPIIFLLMGGIALPGAAVYINRRQLRNRWWQSAVSAAGPIASILVTLLLAIPFWMGWASLDGEQWIWPALAFLISLEIYIVLLNLLPIPSLDGYGIIEPWLPRKIQIKLSKFAKYGIAVLFILLLFVPPFNQYLLGLSFKIGKILGVPTLMVFKGYQLFKRSSSVLLLVVIGIILLGRRLINPQDALYNKGNKFLKLQQYDKAIVAYDKVIQAKPDFYNAWFTRGVALRYLQRYEEALASYDKAIQIKTDFYLAWYYKGLLLEELQHYEEAVAAYDKALKIEPNDPAIWTSRGVALGYLRRYEEAIASCNKAIQIQSDYGYAWYNKAGCYAEQGVINLAIDNLKQAINLDSDRFIKHAKADSSFDLIRESEHFKKLIGESAG